MKEVVAGLAERLVEGRAVDCGRLEVARWLETLTAVLLEREPPLQDERGRQGHRAPGSDRSPAHSREPMFPPVPLMSEGTSRVPTITSSLPPAAGGHHERRDRPLEGIPEVRPGDALDR